MFAKHSLLAHLLALAGCAGLDEPGLLGGGSLEGSTDGKGEEIVGGAAFSDLPAVGALAYGSSSF